MPALYYVERDVTKPRNTETNTRWIVRRSGDPVLVKVYEANLAFKIADLLNRDLEGGSACSPGA